MFCRPLKVYCMLCMFLTVFQEKELFLRKLRELILGTDILEIMFLSM